MKYLFPLLIYTISGISCSSPLSNDHKPKQEAIPIALQDKSGKFDLKELKSYRNESNLVEKLYAELVKKDPELQKLEEEINISSPKWDNSASLFHTYNDKSIHYYNEAENLTGSISDSLLQKRIQGLVSSHQQAYFSYTSKWNEWIHELSQKNIILKDRHTALKIFLTLPIIEKYQRENLPDAKYQKELIRQADSLIQKIEKLVPKL